jgi:hypothetical protein
VWLLYGDAEAGHLPGRDFMAAVIDEARKVDAAETGAWPTGALAWRCALPLTFCFGAAQTAQQLVAIADGES